MTLLEKFIEFIRGPQKIWMYNTSGAEYHVPYYESNGLYVEVAAIDARSRQNNTLNNTLIDKLKALIGEKEKLVNKFILRECKEIDPTDFKWYQKAIKLGHMQPIYKSSEAIKLIAAFEEMLDKEHFGDAYKDDAYKDLEYENYENDKDGSLVDEEDEKAIHEMINQYEMQFVNKVEPSKIVPVSITEKLSTLPWTTPETVAMIGDKMDGSLWSPPHSNELKAQGLSPSRRALLKESLKQQDFNKMPSDVPKTKKVTKKKVVKKTTKKPTPKRKVTSHANKKKI